MKIGALQQYGIPEPIAQAQIYSNRRIYICKEFLKTRLNGYLLHYIPIN